MRETINKRDLVNYYKEVKQGYKETCLNPQSIDQIQYKMGRCIGLIDLMLHMDLITLNCHKKEVIELNDLFNFGVEYLTECYEDLD